MENLVVSTKKKITMDKFFSQVKLGVNSQVKNILSVNARAVVGNAECSNNIASISGRIFVNVVFVNDENMIESVETNYDFVEKQKSGFSMTDIFADDNVGVDSFSVSGTDVVCVISHQVCVSGVFKYEMPIITNEENNLVLKKSNFNSLKMVTNASDNFVVAEECDTNLENAEILLADAKILVSEVSCTVDKIVVEGKVFSEVVFKENEQIGHFDKVFEYKQEIFAENVIPNMIADVNACVKNITVTPEIKEGKTTFVYAVDVFAQGVVFEECEYEVVNDLFSLNSEVQTVYDYLESKNISEIKSGDEIVVSQTDVSLVADFDDVLAVGNVSASATSVEIVDDNLMIGVQISAIAYCKTVDSLVTIPVTYQTVIQMLNNEKKFVDDIDVVASVSSFKVKVGKDLDVNFKVEYVAKLKNEISAKYIKNYENIGEKLNNFYGIKVYIAKEGQSVFDVAKVLNVKPETIISQNQVEDVFEQGQKIYVYSPANLA